VHLLRPLADFYSISRPLIGTYYGGEKGNKGSWHSTKEENKVAENRLATQLKWPGSDQSPEAYEKLGKYKLGIRRTLEQYAAFSGVDTIHQKLKKSCRVEYVPWMKEQMHSVYSEETQKMKKRPSLGAIPERLKGLRGYESMLEKFVERGKRELESVEEEVVKSQFAKELYEEGGILQHEVMKSKVAQELVKEGKLAITAGVKSKVGNAIIKEGKALVKEVEDEARALSIESLVFVVGLLAVVGFGLFCAMKSERRHKARHEKYSA
jgi:hypothetical protein